MAALKNLAMAHMNAAFERGESFGSDTVPIYEYECERCGHSLETIQKISDAPLRDCPSCGVQGALRKLVSAAGFRLKGTGWYETDFKQRGKKPADAGKTDAAKADTASAKQTSADTKPPGSGKTADSTS